MWIRWANYRDSLMEGNAVTMATVVLLFKSLFVFMVSIPILYLGLWHTPQGLLLMLLSLAYSIAWSTRFLLFPDKTFDRSLSWMGVFFMVSTVLLPILLIPYVWILVPMLIPLPIAIAGGVLGMYGILLNGMSDLEKYGATHLYVEGAFRGSRHPNYRGMLFTYMGMCVVSGHILPWILLTWIWLSLMWPNVKRLEEHMEGKYGVRWRLYTARTSIL